MDIQKIQRIEKIRGNFWDHIVGWWNPQAGLQRLLSRANYHAAQEQADKVVTAAQRKYDAAQKGRHYAGWQATDTSVNQEVIHALSYLRSRSRDLSRNNPYMINALRILRNNVVGTGIIPTPKGKVTSQIDAVKEMWSDWAGKTTCDFDDLNIFYGMQALIMRVVVESGEAIIRKVKRPSSEEFPLALQILEGDWIDTSRHNGQWQSDGTMEYYGIKLRKDGKRLGYWLYKNNPMEFGVESEFVPASDIIHVFEPERPGQVRGVPFSCGVATRLRDLDDYEFAERVRAKVAASFAVFVTSQAPSDPTPVDNNGNNIENIQPGMIKTLQPGEQIQVANPPENSGFPEYTKSVLRSIAAGLGVTYEALTNDYSNVNFSSGRMGALESVKNVEHLQWNMMIPRFCDKVFPWFIEMCQLKGVIPWNAKISASWTPPRRDMIDPYKEVQALKEKLRAGLCSWQDVVRELGYVPDELKKELLEDKQMWDTLELKPTIDARFDSNRPPGEADPELMKEEEKKGK
jgi:lambda family phage portal protein